MLPLGMIFTKYGISYLLHADDTQVCIKDPNVTLLKCVEEVKLWVAENLVQLNENKIEIIIFGRTACSQIVNDNLGAWNRVPAGSSKELGASLIFDKDSGL